MAQKIPPSNYVYRTPPASTRPEDQMLYTAGEFRSISRSINSLVETTTSQGNAISNVSSLAPTGVKPGVYANPTVTVATDGRITGIATGTLFPAGGLSGQFLASDGAGGVGWQWASSGGGSSGSSSSTSSSTPSRSVVGSQDILVTTASSTWTLSLNPTGVTAGSYTNVNLTVDAHGRITAAASGTDWTSAIQALQAQVAQLQKGSAQPVITSPNGSTWNVAVDDSGAVSSKLQTANDSISTEDGTTMISTEDSSDYIGY